MLPMPQFLPLKWEIRVPFARFIFATVDMSCLTKLWLNEHHVFNPQGRSLQAILFSFI